MKRVILSLLAACVAVWAVSDVLTDKQQADFQKSVAAFYSQTTKVASLQSQFESSLSDDQKQLRREISKLLVDQRTLQDAVAHACKGTVNGLMEFNPTCTVSENSQGKD